MSSARRFRAARNNNPSGLHLLSSRHVIRRLVDAAGLSTGDLVVDLGAGPGTLTGRLAATGARVLAVEQDERFVSILRRRFDRQHNVSVVPGDLREVRLPGRRFAVVANPPFALSTVLLRRLLTPAASGLDRAELVLEWGLAKRLTAAAPRDLELAGWAIRYELCLRERVPAAEFSPAPTVDAARVGIRRRAGLDRRTRAVLCWLVRTAHRPAGGSARRVLAGLVGDRRAQRILRRNGIQPSTVAIHVPIGRWLGVAAAVAADRSVAVPTWRG